MRMKSFPCKGIEIQGWNKLPQMGKTCLKGQLNGGAYHDAERKES